MNFMEWWFSKFSFNLKVFFFPFQGSSEAEPVLQAEEAPALAAPPTGALHLPHQLQRHPAGFAAPCPAMPAPSRVQSEREPRDGKGESRPVSVYTKDAQQIHTDSAHVSPYNAHPTHPYTTTHTNIQIHKPLFEGENTGWRHTGPQTACRLVQSMQM